MFNVVIVHRTDKFFKYDEEIFCSCQTLEDAEKYRREKSSGYTLNDFREKILGIFIRPAGK